MNEASERVLLKFAELLRNNPNGNVPFLWVQAGGRVASQQSVERTQSKRAQKPSSRVRKNKKVLPA